MTAIGVNNYNANLKLAQPQGTQSTQSTQIQPGEIKGVQSVSQIENKQVTISDKGRALLAASTEIEAKDQVPKVADKGIADKVESFTSGVLGMDHPDYVEEKADDSYSAGQFFKGVLTVGALLLAVV